MFRPLSFLPAVCLLCVLSVARADPPSVEYIFPAGGKRGTTVHFKVGGYNLHDSATLEMRGEGIEAGPRITRTETLFFEGPVIPQPASQRGENYPKDYAGQVKIAADAPDRPARWRVATSQGITPARKFILGDLPEIVEEEIDGEPIPTEVTLPVTINGRIFPREDVDVWTFRAEAGQTITCEVNAARLGSPLDSRLEVRDPSGRRIAENLDTLGTDSRLRFTAETDGDYAVLIHDARFEGLQHYVYRLTITAGPYIDAVYPLGGRRGSTLKLELAGANLPQSNISLLLPDDGRGKSVPETWSLRDAPLLSSAAGGVDLELDDLPELIEDEKPDSGEGPQSASVPAVWNGRISRPGQADLWAFEAKGGEQYLFDLRASRLGSPLDSVVTVLDSTGKQLGQNDDFKKGETDSRLTVKIPADGAYTVRVEDRLSSRGGPHFAYRLRVTETKPDAPGFRLLLPGDVLNVERGGEAKLKLNVQRLGGFKDEIDLAVDNLPAGVTVAETKVGKNRPNHQLTFKAEAGAKVETARLVIRGTAETGEGKIEARAVFERGRGEPDQEELLLRVAVPTPFKFAGVFETNYASRGAVHVRHYTLERSGFEGPIEVMPADIQIRHLQGVTGPTIVLPPEATEFDYPVTLPPWMQVGRTSRTCIMVVGVVTDPDGTKHKVCYSSLAQNDQIIALVDPGRLSVQAAEASIRAQSGGEAQVTVRVERGSGLEGPVTVELVVPPHIHGVKAEAVKLPADSSGCELRIHFDEEQFGPFNMPLTIRASTTDERGYPVTAEAPLTVVPAR